MTPDHFIQAWILFSSSLAVALMVKPNGRFHHHGCWIGLIGQPAWYYTSWQSGQWGQFLACFVFTGSFMFGVFCHCRRIFKG
ncbi:hypothetical protein [Herminiimonas contaminans]|uniref:Uncharacterized protein n=1 Tax=Herminiimonas contaminans TaxID=1111140 RepID=A0ABS0EQ84_9BURK|nr:hypothetical protein [Herminiimonas contaminans]MBF8176944.1 hypothetical protein [Herminiimonas contaminans]